MLYKAKLIREQVLAASAKRIRRKANRGSVLACCRKTYQGCLTAAGAGLCQPCSAPFPVSKPPEAVRLFDSLILVSPGDISYATPLPETTQVLGWWKFFTCSLSHPVCIRLCMLLKAHTETRKGHRKSESNILCLTNFYCTISSSHLGVRAFGYFHDRVLVHIHVVTELTNSCYEAFL